ncbi:MAG: hypothetical protein LBK76_11040, partial [Verrucomicrobiales bacterium]|nr:hypothetical protein [Verrucomicrobiales bacterium]
MAIFICAICGLTALPLTVNGAAGDNLIVNNTTVTEADTTHLSNGNTNAAVEVSNSGFYSGTNVTLTGTSNAGGALGQNALRTTTGGTFNLINSTLSTSGTANNSIAIILSGSAVGLLRDVNVNTVGGVSSYAINVSGSSALTMIGGTISTNSNSASGINLNGAATAHLENVEMKMAMASGLFLQGTSVVTGSDVRVVVNRGNSIHAIDLRGGSRVELSDIYVHNSGQAGRGIFVTGTSTLNVTGGVIITSGSYGYGVTLSNSSTGRLAGVAVTVLNEGDQVGVLAETYSTLTVVSSSVHTTGSAIAAALSSANGTLILEDTTLTTEGPAAYGLLVTGNGTAEMTGGSASAAQGAGIGVIGSTSRVTVSGADITGTVGLFVSNANPNGDIRVDLGDATQVHNGVSIVNNSHLTLSVTGNSSVDGEVTASGSSNSVINFDNSTLSGNVTASDHAVIDLTVSGSDSTLLGDIAQNDEAAVTVTLDDNATGKGGYHGGNLITGGDSVWAFTKDSAADLIDNHGIIHLGTPDNYIALHSDTISGDGTWFFPVNSDTGAKSTVTGSTAADSHPRGKLIVSG